MVSRDVRVDGVATHRELHAVEAVRNVLDHSGCNQDLLGARGDPGQRLAALRVQLGEHVVEDQHRLDVVGAAAVGRTPAAARAPAPRTRRGWRSPWPGRRRAAAPGRRGAARPGRRRARPPGGAPARTRPAAAPPARRPVGARQRAARCRGWSGSRRDRLGARGHLGERLDGGGRQRGDQLQAPGQQRRTVLGEVAVPDVEGAQVAAGRRARS